VILGTSLWRDSLFSVFGHSLEFDFPPLLCFDVRIQPFLVMRQSRILPSLRECKMMSSLSIQMMEELSGERYDQSGDPLNLVLVGGELLMCSFILF
jgi:hypothetical protein